jgi:hypothetical protein
MERIAAKLGRASGYLLGLLLALAALSFLFHLSREDTPHFDAAIQVDKEIDRSQWRFHSFQPVGGTGFLRASLVATRSQSAGLFSSMTLTSAVQNYAFYNLATGATHWLLPDQPRVIMLTTQIPEDKRGEEDEPVVAFLYHIVEQDSNGDGRLSDADAKLIAISDPSGSRLTTIATVVQGTHGFHFEDPARLVMFYTTKGSRRVIKVDLTTHTVLSEGPLAEAPPAPK